MAFRDGDWNCTPSLKGAETATAARAELLLPLRGTLHNPAGSDRLGKSVLRSIWTKGRPVPPVIRSRPVYEVNLTSSSLLIVRLPRSSHGLVGSRGCALRFVCVRFWGKDGRHQRLTLQACPSRVRAGYSISEMLCNSNVLD